MPVLTLCLLCCGAQCPVASLQDVTCGLVLCCLALEYVSLSQRFFPEALNFLLGVLHLAVADKTNLGTVHILLPAVSWLAFSTVYLVPLPAGGAHIVEMH